jgi:phenylpyruvate tautomerase PptA (4-oxalocrotonate tautomerase family)
MPIYTCTIAESTLTADTKRALAVEVARIHSSINHVPSTYVNVAYHELAADDLYTDGVPASPVLVSGWVRAGHPQDDTTRLATEIAAAVSRICDIEAERVLVVIESSPARSAVEGGRVLPEPGQEKSWLAGSLRRAGRDYEL